MSRSAEWMGNTHGTETVTGNNRTLRLPQGHQQTQWGGQHGGEGKGDEAQRDYGRTSPHRIRTLAEATHQLQPRSHQPRPEQPACRLLPSRPNTQTSPPGRGGTPADTEDKRASSSLRQAELRAAKFPWLAEPLSSSEIEDSRMGGRVSPHCSL